MLDKIIMTSAEYGMVPLEGMLARLVREGVITLEVAQAYAIRPADVARYVKGGE